MTLNPKHSKTSLEGKIHEEEVKYKEAFRMNAQFDVLKSILVKIKRLKAELNEEKKQLKTEEMLSSDN